MQHSLSHTIKPRDIAKRSRAIKRRHPANAADGGGLHNQYRNDRAWDVVSTLCNAGTDPSRLLELYYWTREPGIVEMMRAYLDLPETAQRNLGDFLLSGKPHAIESTFDTQGRLVLTHTGAPGIDQSEALRQSVGH